MVDIDINLNWDDSLATASLVATLAELVGQHDDFIPAALVAAALEQWHEETDKDTAPVKE